MKFRVEKLYIKDKNKCYIKGSQRFSFRILYFKVARGLLFIFFIFEVVGGSNTMIFVEVVRA